MEGSQTIKIEHIRSNENLSKKKQQFGLFHHVDE